MEKIINIISDELKVKKFQVENAIKLIFEWEKKWKRRRILW